ncbi:helix-turn-helix domain-containing protein [Brevundimonas faecalis]|uniref:DNA-binding CsgD family transcriptional regulator n=1 Tax=Brevundimonas faecalis TaxID=947378 RepID=A0ABV2RGR6_9CAUL
MSFKLTPRELEIVRLAGERLGDKEIAQRLGLSPRTVQNHLHRAYEKLGVSDRLQAARRLSDSYSGEPLPLSDLPISTPVEPVIAAPSAAVADRKTRSGLYGWYAALDGWRRPRKLGGSLLWLVIGWALVWLIFIMVGVSLVHPVLEALNRMRWLGLM